MRTTSEGILLRIFIGEADVIDRKPIYEIIIQQARETGLSGATVIRGVESFGSGSYVHTAKILRLSEDLPMIIEIVDSEEKINLFISSVEELFVKAGCGGLITTERVNIIRYLPEK